jgi:TolA-binding protein
VTPAPLGAPATSTPEEITTALSLAQTDKEAAIAQLRELTQSPDPAVAGTAAFYLGELLFADDQLAASIQSFRFAMDFGKRSPVFERAQEALLHALGYMKTHSAKEASELRCGTGLH